MPRFNRKRGGRRRRKTAWYNRKYSVGQMASKAIRGVNYIRKLINVEKKFLDTVVTATTQGTAGTFTPLTYIAEGDDYNSRDGHSILTQGFLFRMRLTANSTSVVNFMRIILFVDKEFAGTVATTAQLLETTTEYMSPLQHDQGRRFSILMDKIVALDYNGKGTVSFNKYFKINSHIKFVGTGATAADGKEGHIFLFTMSDNNTNQPGWGMYSRIRFTDN